MFKQWYDADYDLWLVIWYKNDMSSFRAIKYDTIQWLEIDIVMDIYI